MHENFFYNLKVYYEDTDASKRVYYANYLKYIERARTEALLSIGLSNTKIKKEFGTLNQEVKLISAATGHQLDQLTNLCLEYLQDE